MFNQKHEREKFDYRFNGMYRGVVVDVDDPKGAGRVRVRVHSVYDGVQDDAIPWAQYADPLFMTAPDSGSRFTPDEGDRVWVFFEEGDHMHPVFFAGAPSAIDLPSEATTTNRVIKTKKGHIIEIDDTDGNERIKLTHSSGTYVEMNDSGELEIDVVSNCNINVDGDVNLRSTGEALLEGKSLTTVEAAMIKLGIDASSEPVILGMSFIEHYAQHNHGTSVGPSSPPLNPPTPDLLSKKSFVE